MKLKKKNTDHDHEKYITAQEFQVKCFKRKFYCKISTMKFSKQK